MSLKIAFHGGPLHGEVLTDPDEPNAGDAYFGLPRHVFRVTSYGRVGATFDIFSPREFPLAELVGRSLSLHYYRVDQRHIAEDATIWVVASYVCATGKEIRACVDTLRQWAGMA